MTLNELESYGKLLVIVGRKSLEQKSKKRWLPRCTEIRNCFDWRKLCGVLEQILFNIFIHNMPVGIWLSYGNTESVPSEKSLFIEQNLKN